jgi:4-deoxy-L-threo-5-hexosulose-uronate ketol-isomerase
MKTEVRYAGHPDDIKGYDTDRLRKEFLIENLFVPDEIVAVYSLYDRLIIGGAMPVSGELVLETMEELKAGNFLDRREIGLINTGGEAVVTADGKTFMLGYKESLYIGRGVRNVVFNSSDVLKPAKLYFNSAPAHHSYSSRLITLSGSERVTLGDQESSNHRTVNKMLVNTVLKTCQLQMGMTELKKGSVWNTMPVHTHNRRMEAYFYFEIPDNQAVCHFMGTPDETRHIWVRNEQAVISPSWSIHSAAGTSNYTFIWGMAGENLDYGDMEIRNPDTLK